MINTLNLKSEVLTCSEFFRHESVDREAVDGNVLSGRQEVEGEQQYGHSKQVLNVDNSGSLKSKIYL